MVKLVRPDGILRVVLTCVLLRAFLIYFTLRISNFSKLDLPKYQYHASQVNSCSICDGNSEKANCVSKTCKLKSNMYLKGHYSFPTTTIFGFLDNNALNTDEGYFDSVYSKSAKSQREGELGNRNWVKLIGFNSWDSERFLKNTFFNLVYSSEESCAFFPLFSYLLKLLYSLLKRLSHFRDNSSYDDLFLAILVGLALNNFLSILNTVLIYVVINKLLLYNLMFGQKYGVGDVLNDDLLKGGGLNFKSESFKLDNELIRKINNVGYLTCFAFNLSPGFIFTTSLYTEPLYSLFYYSVILILLDLYWEDLSNTPNYHTLGDYPENKNNSPYLNRAEKREEKKDSKSGLKRELKVLLMVVLVFMSGFARSNGLLMILFVFFYRLNNCPLTNYVISKNISKFAQGPKATHDPESSLAKTLRNFLIYWLTNFLYLLISLIPFFLTQLYGYLLYCHKLSPEEFASFSPFHRFVFGFFKLNFAKILGTSNSYANELCKRQNFGPVLIYKYIQAKYWFIKLFFSFDNWNNFVNFTYSFPTVLFLMVYVFRYFCRISKFVRILTNNSENRWKGSKLARYLFVLKVLLNNFEFNVVFHLGILLFSFLLYSHLQIIFRQSLCIVQFFYQSNSVLFYLATSNNNSSNNSNNNNNCNNNNNFNSNTKNNTNYNCKNNNNNGDKENKRGKKDWTFALCFLFYFYNVVLCFVGIILFSNFLGWT